jgi:hypothetical protein
MINEFFEIIELHVFVEKCQYTDQMFKDVESKTRYRDEAIETSFSTDERSNQQIDQSDESFRQQTSILAFDQSFRVIIVSSQAQTFNSDQMNTFICYNCEKSSHMIKHCRSLSTSRI